ncbi:MAG: hypothetical protein H6740_20775 [Alphaproteobacteria bacterium]|nr:hypothetical protein [Alphaproteobacteria bacterium]
MIPADYEADMIGYTLEQLRAFDGGVVLMHDIHGYTAASLEALILAILDAGFSFTSLDDAEVFPGFNGGARADLPWPGEPCTPSDDRCWQTQFDAWCEPSGGDDEGLCVRPCGGYCFEREGASRLFCADAGEDLGRCLAKPSRGNADCLALPGASLGEAVGYGSEDPSAEVCWPEGWN